MKTLNNINWNPASKTVLITALFLFIITGKKVHATDTLKAPPIEVKYLGNVGSNPVFQVQVDNENEEELHLTLRDEFGYFIYSETIKEKKFVKRIQMKDIDWDNVKITLFLKNRKGNQVQAFQILKTTRMVEDVAVTRL